MWADNRLIKPSCPPARPPATRPRRLDFQQQGCRNTSVTVLQAVANGKEFTGARAGDSQALAGAACRALLRRKSLHGTPSCHVPNPFSAYRADWLLTAAAAIDSLRDTFLQLPRTTFKF